MPVRENKPTTLASEVSTPEASSNVLPKQGAFHQHLRRLAVSAVDVLIEQVMREVLEQVHRSLLGRMHAQSSWVSQRHLHPRFGHAHWAH